MKAALLIIGFSLGLACGLVLSRFVSPSFLESIGPQPGQAGQADPKTQASLPTAAVTFSFGPTITRSGTDTPVLLNQRREAAIAAMASIDVIADVRDDLGLSGSVDELARSLQVEAIADDTVSMEVRLRSSLSDREIGARLVNALARHWEMHLPEAMAASLREMSRQADRQVATLTVKAEESEAKRIAFEMEQEGPLPDSPQRLQQMIADARGRMSEAGDRIAQLEKERGDVEAYLKVEPELVRLNDELRSKEKELDRLEREMRHHDDMHRRSTHYAVVQTRKAMEQAQNDIQRLNLDIAAVQAGLIDIPIGQGQRRMQQIDRELDMLRSQHREAELLLARLSAIDENYSELRRQHDKLESEAASAREALQQWKVTREVIETALTSATRGVTGRIVQRAETTAP